MKQRRSETAEHVRGLFEADLKGHDKGKLLFKAVDQLVNEEMGKNGGLSKDGFLSLIERERAVVRQLPRLRRGGGRPANHTLKRVAYSIRARLGTSVREWTKSPAAAERKLAELITDVVKSRGCELEFALGADQTFDEDLRYAVETAYQMEHPDAALDENLKREIADIVSNAVHMSIDSCLETKAVPETECVLPGAKSTLQNFMFKGEEYAPVKVLGEGGFGQVVLCQSKADPDRTIALKVCFQPDDRAALLTEVQSHVDAFGKGSSNVVGFHGLVRFPEGQFGIAMELAPLGGVDKVGEHIQ